MPIRPSTVLDRHCSQRVIAHWSVAEILDLHKEQVFISGMAATCEDGEDAEQPCQILPSPYPFHMGTMNISLPDSLKSFVDEQVAGRGYGTSSEYVRELIRADRDRQRLRTLLLDGAASQVVATADDNYFNGLRERVRRASPE